ncbi:FAD-dependent oxidoreductase [Ruminiclostridium josui]|uniref:FAD-dependent oxidoreductase n=1 Tax=Ruminiclostridium josui TaxID=1499 RepID=UPI00046731D9|nr:FAD-binding protein [Ruminiclostridium josui]
MLDMTKTDILVVGGSLAGISAAITAKEAFPELEVSVVEKYTSGYAGKANRGAGIMFMMGNSDPEDFVKYHIHHIGDYLNDQNALRKYAMSLDEGVRLLDKWSNGKICKNKENSFKTLKWLAQITGTDEYGKRTFDEPEHFPWTLVAIELDFMLNVCRYARSVGVKIIDRTGIVDLLKDGDRISGAVGYNIDTQEQIVFQAKSVILATGSQNYRIMPMWSPGRGEGMAAAFRAGAQFRNCEFGSFYNWTSLDNFESDMGVEFALFNDKGENVGEPHTRGEHPDVDQNSLAEWYKQMRDGNGPMHYRMELNPLMPYLTSVLGSDSFYERPYADRFWNNLFFNAFSQRTSDEVIPGFIGEFSGLQVDMNMATTIPGLFAAGDICYGGSAVAGAVPPPPGRVRGSGLAFAQYSGRIAGLSAAEYTSVENYGNIDEIAVAQIDMRFKKPLSQNGNIEVMDFLPEIHKVIQPLGNSLYRSEERILAALKRIQELKLRTSMLKAEDAHQLFGCNEIESMLICAELFFTTSLLRKESRGWFLREDYPEKLNKVKWYTAKSINGSLITDEMEVPFENYKYKPENIGGNT